MPDLPAVLSTQGNGGFEVAGGKACFDRANVDSFQFPRVIVGGGKPPL